MNMFGYSHRKSIAQTVDRANEILKDQPKFVPVVKVRAKRYEPQSKKPLPSAE